MADERDSGTDWANPFLLTFTQFERDGQNVVRMQIAKHLGWDPDVYEWESERRLTDDEMAQFARWNEEVVLKAALACVGKARAPALRARARGSRVRAQPR
ncbi:MAG: hypothetical protein FJ087_02105 [Deltaproteobacteria bacterium]|nr:hypothetical protein [Deltaproteobacteria bacterium]